MKTLYLECNMGAAGDMLMAALLELVDDKDAFVERLNALGLPGVRAQARRVEREGVVGTHMSISVGGAEEESHDMHDGHAHAYGSEHHHYDGGEHVHEGDHHHHHDDEKMHESERHHHCGSEHVSDNAHHHHDGGEYVHESERHHHGGEKTREGDHHHHCEGEHVHDNAHNHHGGEHHHSGLRDIEGTINELDISARVKADALAVYGIIAEAEAFVHGKTVELVHFHEVGALDAVADIVGVCLLMEQLSPDSVCASAVNVGGGSVRCAHGILPVPAPATARILCGVKSYGGDIKAELCTPTGAALLKHFVSSFGAQPVMSVEGIGYGMGKKPLPANFVRAFMGEAEAGANEEVAELCCQLDDMTGEALGFAREVLTEAGALDVFTSSIQMKKGRPGVLLTCICRAEQAERFATLMLEHTTTLGVRATRQGRYSLAREFYTVKTACGEVRFKRAHGYGVEKRKPEYEDVRARAIEHGATVAEILRVCNAAEKGGEA